MGLFIVRHEHDPAHCPAGDPASCATMLNHLSRREGAPTGGRHPGRGSGQRRPHALHDRGVPDEVGLRVSASRSRWRDASRFTRRRRAAVVTSGGCTMRRRSLDGSVQTSIPRTACQRAIEAGLVVHRAQPLNGETPIPALIGGVVMPSARFYVRNHFQIPMLDATTWRLRGGRADRPSDGVEPARSAAMPRRPGRHAGVRRNGRFLLDPPAPASSGASAREHRRVDRCPPHRGARSGRVRLRPGKSCSAAPTWVTVRRTTRRDRLRAQPQHRRSQGRGGPARLRDERRDDPRFSTAIPVRLVGPTGTASRR